MVLVSGCPIQLPQSGYQEAIAIVSARAAFLAIAAGI
jgi:hypothetical protein